MSLTRRLFARALPALPLAMKAAASAGVSGPLTEAGSLETGTAAGWANAASLMTSFDMGKHLRDQIAELIDARSSRRADYVRAVRRLDADLASSLSLSLSARVRLQGERDERRDFERQHGCLQQQLLDTIGGKP